MSDVNYSFDIPINHKSIIKVIGVGGGGSNAVTHMYDQGIKDVEFVVCNTDAQALESSVVPNKLQLGISLTEGLGAGANPEKGKAAALESKDDIRELLSSDTKMVFVTAGMGGGTGTGAAPVIAKIARDMDILTVGIVTAPFAFEGRRKIKAAETGIKELRDNCDTVLVILNDKLREIFGNLSIRSAFAQADNILTTAAKSIAEIITVNSEMNVDFEDVRTVMKDAGAAVMGSAVVAGENRARRAAENALSSPLLNNTDIKGAQKILLSISYGTQNELTMDELTEITDYIEDQVGFDADELILGQGIDDELGDNLRVTIIATGFENGIDELKREKTVFDLERDQHASTVKTTLPSPSNFENQRKNEVVSEPVQQKNVAPRAEKKEEPIEPDVVRYSIDDSYEVTEMSDDDVFGSEIPVSNEENYSESQDDMLRRQRMIHASKERINRLRGLRNDIDDFRNKLEVPAYIRRGKRMNDIPKSEEPGVSRYNLSDDKDILGDNKFLHDNVD